MKRLARVLVLAFLAGFALADFAFGADLAKAQAAPIVRKAPAPVASGPGFYAGINAGVGVSDGKFSWLVVPGTGNLKPSAGLAGLTVGFGGYLGQGGMYLGVEADG